MDPCFIHLRLHSEYSLSDGLVQINALIKKALSYQMPALAITDQSNLFATVKFFKAALQAGIKPIIAADIWLENHQQQKQPFRVTLFCQHNQGYQNLMALLSLGFMQGQSQGKAIIRKEWLIKHQEGLIVLSGAEEGDLGQALLQNNEEAIKESLDFWTLNFPKRFYIELRRTGVASQEKYIQAALLIAEEYCLPVIATNDVRFLEPDEFEAHEARVCIHEGHILADARRPRKFTEEQYFKSPADMQTLFADIPSSLANTVELAKRCNVTLTLGKSFLPQSPVPSNFTIESYLVSVATQGLTARLAKRQCAEEAVYTTRLTRELDVINSMGFAGYFLIVADFTRWARDNGVPVGPGRGSGPGSLVAYALNITDLDPLQYELLFERFLNPERVSMPDFDIDFCMEGRDRVIEYVMRTHGREAVAQIITYGTMTARSVVRDVGRVLGMGYGFVDKIAKLIPFEIGMTLEKALTQEELLHERYIQEDDIRTLIDLAKKLEGITRNAGKHAGGVVIAPSKLTEFTPLYCEEGQAEHIVTQFDKDDVEAVGLVKFDFLGLRTLTIIDWALKEINTQASPLDINDIPMDDAATFALLKACKTTAVFQLESRGMKDLVKRLQPDCFEDIIALVALFRPGPLQSGMVDDFINRKHGRAQVSYPHPLLEPILRPTYGVIVYQEQVMQIAQVLGGYSLGSADLLRRAMGKKKPEEMAMHREIFSKGAIANNVPEETANFIFDLMEKFAGYGFNKSHSAAYAMIAYQTAWLKTHYPAAYMAAVLSSDMDNTDKVVNFIEECQMLNIQICPPNINESDYAFKVASDKKLIYGLGSVKGAGQAAIESLVETRKKTGPFKDFFDFCCRVDLRKMNRRILEALIKAGAFDSIGPHRASILASIDLALQHAEQVTRDKSLGQANLFGDIELPQKVVDYVNTPQWSEHIRLLGEKETLGLYLTGHPIQRYLGELKHFIHARIAEVQPKNQPTLIAGIITSVRVIQTKRGDRMAVATLDDASGTIDILCFAEIFQKYREFLVKDQLIIVSGEISVDEYSGGFRMLTREILNIEEARERYAKYLQIRFSSTDKTDVISHLAELLKQHRGGRCRIAIDYARPEAKANLNLGENWRVRPSDTLLQSLREIFLGDNIEVVY